VPAWGVFILDKPMYKLTLRQLGSETGTILGFYGTRRGKRIRAKEQRGSSGWWIKTVQVWRTVWVEC